MPKKSFAHKIISIFLGASWAIIAIFIMLSYKLFSTHSLAVSISATFVGLLIGLFVVLVFEALANSFEKTQELKKQTLLLGKILEELKDKKISNN